MQTILMKATGHSSKSPIVILSHLNIGTQCSTPASESISRTLSAVRNWLKCYCAPRAIVSALFSKQASMAVAAIALGAMMWHNASIDNAVVAGESVATDCLLAMPWAMVWTLRAIKKGGELC